METKLTVLIPCKDERRNIRPCIESALSIADEFLIADSGSTDGTLDIVRDIFSEIDTDCRIIEREYVNSANFKNWAIPQARHEWVLLIDADERLPPRLVEEIRAVLKDPPENIEGYWIGRDSYYLGHRIRHCGWNSDDVLRLFRRDAGRYRTRWVHAEIEFDSSRSARLNTAFLHYPTWTTDNYLKKLNRYAAWGAMNLRDERGLTTSSFWSLLTRAPLRFLQLYFLRLGFLDGIPGLQVCAFTAFSSFLKQAKLWESNHAIPQPDPEVEQHEHADANVETINFEEARANRHRPQLARRAA